MRIDVQDEDPIVNKPPVLGAKVEYYRRSEIARYVFMKIMVDRCRSCKRK